MPSRTYIGLEAVGMGFKAHLTLCFLGPLDDERINYVMNTMYGLKAIDTYVQVHGFDCFGHGKVPVVTLEPNEELTEYRKQLADQGITDEAFSSPWPHWNPHISLKWEPEDNVKPIIIPPFIRVRGPFLKYKGGDRLYV